MLRRFDVLCFESSEVYLGVFALRSAHHSIIKPNPLPYNLPGHQALILPKLSMTGFKRKRAPDESEAPSIRKGQFVQDGEIITQNSLSL